MADITKCHGTDCPLKKKCFRYTAPDSDQQYYFDGIPGEWYWRREVLGGFIFNHRDFKCSMYCERLSDRSLRKIEHEIAKQYGLTSPSNIRKMSNAIDHEKEERLSKAAAMNEVPLIQLDRLITERKAQALEKNIEAVEYLNQMIRLLFAL